MGRAWTTVLCGVVVSYSAACSWRAEGTSDGGTDEEMAAVVEPGLLCDGSDDLRFAARLVGGGLADPTPMSEIGSFYLYVRGDCRYWVLKAAAYSWADAHEGMLSPEVELELMTALHYPQWADLAGYYAGTGDDVSTVELSDGTSTIRCYGNCAEVLDADVPPEVLELDAVRSWQARLWADGTAATGPLRVQVDEVGNLDPSYPCVVQWPLAWSLRDLTSRSATYIDDPNDTAVLRAIRAELRAGADGCVLGSLHEPIVFTEGDSAFAFWMRDTVPFETATGQIPLP